MLEAGEPIQHVGHVEGEVIASVGRRVETFFSRRHHEPLPLNAPRLQVLLDRDRPELLVLPDDIASVLETVDSCRAHVHGGAGAEDPLSCQLTRLDHLGVGEDRLVIGRGIETGGDAVSEMRSQRPRSFRNDVSDRPQMIVHVDEARNDGLSSDVEDLRVVRNGDVTASADRHDTVVLHHDVALRKDLISTHGDDASPPERHTAAGGMTRRR